MRLPEGAEFVDVAMRSVGGHLIDELNLALRISPSPSGSILEQIVSLGALPSGQPDLDVGGTGPREPGGGREPRELRRDIVPFGRWDGPFLSTLQTKKASLV